MKILFLFIALVGLIPRCAHLINSNYYILGVDSYLFHYLAQNPVNHQISSNGYPWHSGLVYPVWLLSQAIGIYAASIVVPLIIYVTIFYILYRFVLSEWGRIAAIAAVVVWALIPQAANITAAGYLDRDGLSALVVLAAVVATHQLISNNKQQRVYLWTFVIITLIILQWAQWHRYGSLMIVVIFSVVMSHHFLRQSLNVRIRWLFAYGVLLSLLLYGVMALISEYVLGLDRTIIGEMQITRPVDVFLWWGWAVPLMIVGTIIACDRLNDNDVLVLIWIAVAFVGSGIASRVMVLALPAMCILAGLAVQYGLARYREIGGYEVLSRAKVLIAVLSLTLIATSVLSILSIHGNHRMAPNDDWQAALQYLRTETPKNSRIAVLGDFGYWVMDLADRYPVARGNPRGCLDKLSSLYCTPENDVFNQTMRELDCDYFIYSAWEYESAPIWGTLLDGYNDHGGTIYIGFPDEYEKRISIANRTLMGEDVMPVVYRNDSVVIIEGPTDSNGVSSPVPQTYRVGMSGPAPR